MLSCTMACTCAHVLADWHHTSLQADPLFLHVEQAASADGAARLSPEELLAEALRAFKQDADSAAQRASPSQSLSLQLPADGAATEPPQVSQPPQPLLQQSSSLPDLSKGAISEQSPVGESPSPATSEPGPGPQEHQAWGVLRPTPQRIGALFNHVTPCKL